MEHDLVKSAYAHGFMDKLAQWAGAPADRRYEPSATRAALSRAGIFATDYLSAPFTVFDPGNIWQGPYNWAMKGLNNANIHYRDPESAGSTLNRTLDGIERFNRHGGVFGLTGLGTEGYALYNSAAPAASAGNWFGRISSRAWNAVKGIPENWGLVNSAKGGSKLGRLFGRAGKIVRPVFAIINAKMLWDGFREMSKQRGQREIQHAGTMPNGEPVPSNTALVSIDADPIDARNWLIANGKGQIEDPTYGMSGPGSYLVSKKDGRTIVDGQFSYLYGGPKIDARFLAAQGLPAKPTPSGKVSINRSWMTRPDGSSVFDQGRAGGDRRPIGFSPPGVRIDRNGWSLADPINMGKPTKQGE